MERLVKVEEIEAKWMILERFSSPKWEEREEITKENFPLKVCIHKEPSLVRDLIEPAILAMKRTSSTATTRAPGSPEHVYVAVHLEP